MPIITFENVTKQFNLQHERTFKDVVPALLTGKGWAEQKTIFSNLNFSIDAGESVAIVGKNGAGKSTILKLIAGVTYPTTGEVVVAGKVAPMIELGAGFHHELTGYENIFLNSAILGMHKKEIELHVEDIIAFSELKEYIHVPIKRYSTGMAMRLAFAVAIHTTAPILLVDEVLAVGDQSFQQKCLKRLEELKAAGRTTVFVSHDQRAVTHFCERALLLDHGKVIVDDKPAEIFKKYETISNV